MYFNLHSNMANTDCLCYIEIAQELTIENTITLAHYLAQYKTVIH